VKAPLILVKLISFFFYFMANAFAIRFSEMAKPVANASLRQSVIVLILLPFCFSEMANAEHRY